MAFDTVVGYANDVVPEKITPKEHSGGSLLCARCRGELDL